MAYKYQYNPAATDNVSLHDNSRGRAAAGSLTYTRSSHRSVIQNKYCDGRNISSLNMNINHLIKANLKSMVAIKSLRLDHL